MTEKSLKDEGRGHKIGGHYVQDLKWSDGQPVSCYTNFSSRSHVDYKSQNVSGDPGCLLFNQNAVSGKWGIIRCGTRRLYVRKKG